MVLVEHGILKGQMARPAVRHQELLDGLVMLGGLVKILGLTVGQTAEAAIARLMLLFAVLLNLALGGALPCAHALKISALVKGHLAHGVFVGA